MEYKWYDIRKKIIAGCKKTLMEQNVSLSGADIEDATDLFDRVISYPLSYLAVANLQKDMQQTLQRAYIDNVGATADLRNVLNLMDAFLKKILVLACIKSQSEITRSEPTLKILLQWTNASSTFSGITHRIEESNMHTYARDSTGAFIFCSTYIARNKVHESPGWDEEDVLYRLRYAMTSYILVTHHLSAPLKLNYPGLSSTYPIDLTEINETGFVYDFINYGHTTNKIKNRIVESFILNYLYKQSGALESDSLVKEVEDFSRQSLSQSSIRGIIGRLMPDRIHYESTPKKTIVLGDEERERIKAAQESYSLSVSRLLAEIENLLDGYGLKEQTSKVYAQLKSFFDRNCLSIIKILNEQDGEASSERSEEYIEDFKIFLDSVGCPDDKQDQLFRELLQVCSMNDILVKIALGKNFSNISNPDSFASGLKQREKKVYLDTQILLYALCDYDGYNAFSGSPSFLIVKSLIDLARQNQNIHLATISPYVNEAAYHLKRALQLITIDDFNHKSRIKLSDNVFYSYYYYLKENDQLNEGINTLSDFLDELFGVSYDDILLGNFEQNIYGFLVDILHDDYGIEVEETPHFSDEEVNNSERVFTNVLLAKKDARSPIAAHKDAIMGLYLFNNEHRSISEPFFLSWDKAFSAYRKEYISSFQRHNPSSWLLFGPAKFVNHLNLLDMKIDVDVMTEDLISIIEDDDTVNQTKHVLDSIRKLLERSNVNSRQKRKVYSEIIFSETDFPNDTVAPDERLLKKTNDFALAFDKLMNLMQSGEHRFAQFEGIIGEEERFKSIVAEMRRRLDIESIDECASAVFDELLKEISD